jgi:hypothetical protein
MPLPATGPVTEPQLEALPSIGDDLEGEEAARLARIVAAVNSFIRDLPIAGKALRDTQEAADTDGWPDRIVEGGVLLGARLWRRKDTPAGVVASPNGPVYVRRNDPDIAMLLGLGDEHGKPRTG